MFCVSSLDQLLIVYKGLLSYSEYIYLYHVHVQGNRLVKSAASILITAIVLLQYKFFFIIDWFCDLLSRQLVFIVGLMIHTC